MQAGQADDAAPPLSEAHRALRADPRYQFDAEAVVPLPVSKPNWLDRLIGSEAFQTFLDALGHVLAWVLKIGLVALAVTVLVYAARAGLTAWRRRERPEGEAPAPYRPSREAVRTLLEDAARLAGEGRYGDAVRLILRRSIEDMERQRPGAVRDAMTAREIGGLAILGPAAREAFGAIAALVERAHFAGRALTASDYEAARGAYEGFAEGRLA